MCNEVCPLDRCNPFAEICPASPETKLAMHREHRRLADEQEKDRALAIQTQRRASLAMARDIRSGLARLGFKKYDGRIRRRVYRQAMG